MSKAILKFSYDHFYKLLINILLLFQVRLSWNFIVNNRIICSMVILWFLLLYNSTHHLHQFNHNISSDISNRFSIWLFFWTTFSSIKSWCLPCVWFIRNHSWDSLYDLVRNWPERINQINICMLHILNYNGFALCWWCFALCI